MNKPKCKLLHEDGNIFDLIGKTSTVLNKIGMCTERREMGKPVFLC